MAFGFPAYSQRFERFRGFSRATLARAAEDALDELGWHPQFDGKWRIRALVPAGSTGIFLTWGARFLVEIEDDELFLRSEGSFPLAWLDLGQHDRNIQRFLDALEDALDDPEEM